MTQPDFTAALESELHLRGVPFGRAALLDFVASAWPLIEENPNTGFWAGEFLRTQNVLPFHRLIAGWHGAPSFVAGLASRLARDQTASRRRPDRSAAGHSRYAR
jgi:hypothetical protein